MYYVLMIVTSVYWTKLWRSKTISPCFHTFVNCLSWCGDWWAGSLGCCYCRCCPVVKIESGIRVFVCCPCRLHAGCSSCYPSINYWVDWSESWSDCMLGWQRGVVVASSLFRPVRSSFCLSHSLLCSSRTLRHINFVEIICNSIKGNYKEYLEGLMFCQRANFSS